MKTVRRLLQPRSGTVWTIAPETPIAEAMAQMAAKDIGALLVTEGERLVGIVTERDVARRLAKGEAAGLRVREMMTERVLYVRPDHTVEECMALMTERHVRHLPVLEEGRLVGMVSIRDVVADVIAEKSFMIEQLEHYIYDIPPYGRTASEA
ncbi:MAG TPA: CBS domain-containing protein [Chloroflexaceae bacterium]|nr:CBS domain-containing protein [Chloroflexaceae bacterium]